MLAALMLPTLAFANGGVDSSARAALDSSLVTVSLKESSSGGELLVENPAQAVEFPGSVKLTWSVDYDFDEDGKINDGDTLSIQLVPEDPEKNFISLPSIDMGKRDLVDDDTVVGIADMASGLGADIEFEAISASFTAMYTGTLRLSVGSVREYFEDHPDEDTVEFSYKLQINGKDTGRSVVFSQTR